MKYFKLISALTIAMIVVAVFSSNSFRVMNKEVPLATVSESGMKWYSMDEVADLQTIDSRPVIVDVYTDWCKWCKVMDQKTFSDVDFSNYLNSNFYMVKLNAESKTPIHYKGKNYTYVNNGRRGYNELAVELCQGSLSYPSFVVLDKNLDVLEVTRGFKSVDQFKLFLNTKVKSTVENI